MGADLLQARLFRQRAEKHAAARWKSAVEWASAAEEGVQMALHRQVHNASVTAQTPFAADFDRAESMRRAVEVSSEWASAAEEVAPARGRLFGQQCGRRHAGVASDSVSGGGENIPGASVGEFQRGAGGV